MLSDDKKKSLDYLKGIFETASEGIFFVDTNGQISRTNPAFLKLLGYRERELEGKLFIEIIHRKARVKKIISTSKMHHFRRSSKLPLEMELINKKGTAISVKLRSTLIKDDKGKTVEAIGIVEDLRKDKGEQALEQKAWETQETLHNILTNSGDAILAADGNGRITLVNEALLQMLGYKEDELVGQHLAELSPYKGSFTTISGGKIALDEEYINYQVAKANELFEEGKVINYELYWIRKDGRIIPVEATLSLLKDQRGERRGSIAICRDITERKKTENELKKARDFLENIFKTSVDGIIVTSKGVITMVNQAVEKMLGYSKSELIGKHTYELTPKEKYYEEEGAALIKKLFKEGVIIGEEQTWLKKDGSLVHIELNLALLKDKDGNNKGGVVSIRDITLRKRAEERLRMLERAVEQSIDGIAVADMEGMLQFVNIAWAKMHGYNSVSELLGKHLSIFHTEEQLQKEVLSFNKQVKKNGSNQGEVNHAHKNGKVFSTWMAATLLRNKEGKPLGFVATARDITERKKAEEALKQSEEKYYSLIETANDAIVSTNEEGIITSFNKKAEEMYGYSREEIMGKSILTLFAPSEIARHNKGLEKFKNSKTFSQIETPTETINVRKNGQEFPVETSISSLEVHGEHISTSFIRDITGRKNIEHTLLQSEKLRSLGELAGGVAHDFNNVLAAILGRVQLLGMQIGPLPEKGERRKATRDLKKSLEVIEKAALDGTETIRRIQEFSRKRDDDKHFADVDINKVIDDALEFTKVRWKDEAETKGITIHIKENLSPLAPIAGSAPELREVVTNLINNAVDAMPQGGEIRLRTLMNNNHVVIEIVDTGTGILHALADRIFDPFFTTKGPQSTGLGMSVSYGIINRHRGTINFNSVEGEGTTFTIQLPLSKQTSERREVTVFRSKKQRKARILVIEDEQDVLELLKDILTDNGHEVETASHGRQGLKMFCEHHFDLVFTALGMPEMSGWQVAGAVKKINKETPVALITGWEVQLNQSELKRSGVDLLVNKPFQVDEVRRLVEEGIDIQIKGKKTTKLTRDGKKKKTSARKNRNQGRK